MNHADTNLWMVYGFEACAAKFYYYAYRQSWFWWHCIKWCLTNYIPYILNMYVYILTDLAEVDLPSSEAKYYWWLFEISMKVKWCQFSSVHLRSFWEKISMCRFSSIRFKKHLTVPKRKCMVPLYAAWPFFKLQKKRVHFPETREKNLGEISSWM